MKKELLFTALVFMASATFAQIPVYLLDLSDESISYNENNVWEGVYSNENFSADGFVFSHSAPYGVGYYEGFVPSCNTDTANHFDSSGWTANQWGCMAMGGVDLNGPNYEFYADAIEGKPFLINYYSSFSSNQSDYGTSYITCEDETAPVGVYVCNSPWGYYGCTVGDGFAQPLVDEGGYYKVTFHGVNIENETTRSVDFFLAERRYSDRNMDGVVNEDDNFTLDHWAWCDLTSLGQIDILYITMDSSDKGDYGMNTSTLVCLDGLEYHGRGNVNSINSDNNRVYAADGNLYLSLAQEQAISLYNAAGMLVFAQKVDAGSHILNIGYLESGIYFVQHRGGCSKVVVR